MKRTLPPPVRRIEVSSAPTVAQPQPGGAVAPAAAPVSTIAAQRAARPAAARALERMRIESVSLAYGERWVVRDVTLPVRQGEVLALIGASGSGKTTLLRALNRLTEVTASASRAGRITLDGQEIGDIEATDLRRRVSMVFQQPNPFPMSIFENVA
jgi:phosphate transport system ATP-binding protein